MRKIKALEKVLNRFMIGIYQFRKKLNALLRRFMELMGSFLGAFWGRDPSGELRLAKRCGTAGPIPKSVGLCVDHYHHPGLRKAPQC